MGARHSIWLVVACLLLALWVAPTRAEERNYWRHSKGHFENTTGNHWDEKIEDATNHFVETARTDKYVELYNRNTNVTVRLYSDRCMVKGSFTDFKFQKFYDGHWGK